jgi:hypothetical protein
LTAEKTSGSHCQEHSIVFFNITVHAYIKQRSLQEHSIMFPEQEEQLITLNAL